jgi:hypothetical protein
MLGRTSFLQTANRERSILTAIALAIALTIGLSALAPAAAHASGCTDSWTNTAGGNWFTGSNWSKNAPPTEAEEACITANGTYTVTMTQTSTTSTVSVRSLTVGGESGTQTLAVGSSCSENASLTTATGIVNGAQGAIVLTNGEGCGTNVTVLGHITNAGTLTSEPGSGGKRQLKSSIANTGVLAINTETLYNGSSTTLTNEGVIQLAEGKSLTATTGNTVTNGTGGSIATTGSGNVFLSHATFNEGAGTASGTTPVIVDDGTLNYGTGGGSSAIALRGTSSVSGTISSGQSLLIQSTCSEHVYATAATGLVNAGTIKLTNADGCGDNATLTISTGTLANSGKLVTEPAHGGTRTLQGSITNTGTIAINVNTAYNGTEGVLINEGAVNLAEATQLTISNKGSFTNGAGGKIAATGSADVLAGDETSFTEGAGTTSGTKPVIVDDGTLTYTGAGASAIALHGSSKLGGSLSAGQSLSIESTCSEHAYGTAAASFTNAGAIKLTNGDGCGNNATLTVSAGTLTNSGTLVTEPANGGARTLQGNVTNTGTIAIHANTAYNGTEGVLTNEGALDIGEALQLTVSNAGAVINGSGGNISVTGTGDLFMSLGTTFTEGAGTTSGTKPVIVDDGTLDYTGTGASAIALHGSTALDGNLAAEQTLSIESTCSEHAYGTAAASFTNAGKITLTNGDGCGNNATLTISAGTLTNSGRIVTEPANGGTRNLLGNITNASAGTLALNTNTIDSSGASLVNAGLIKLATGVTFSLREDPTVTNEAGGAITAAGNGALVQVGGTFNQSSGQDNGAEPVILEDLTLNYTGHGSGRIALRGTSTLTGSIKNEERLMLESTCSAHAVITDTAGIVNHGTIELTNGDGCGNNVTLNLNGETLTNDGAVNIDNVHGGIRTIEGSLINASTLFLAAGEKLALTGNFTQTSAGKLKVYIASVSAFGSMSVGGSATLAGTLVSHQTGSFKGAAGEKFAILSATSVTGTFATETEDQINSSGLYYQPTYSATGVTLVVAQATLSLSVNSGLPGSVVTVSGGGYMPGDTITPTFTDHKGVVTTFSSVTVNGSGEFSTEITIPAAAAVGAGTIKVTSTITGVDLSSPFTVT